MTAIVGLLFKFFHRLHRHHWFGAPLDRWLSVLIISIAGLMTIRWLPGGITGIVVCGVLVLILFMLQTWAARNSYVVFRNEAAPVRQMLGAPMLQPMDKLPVRATGLFEVEGKERAFTELQAYLRSFETREHVVMALVPPSIAFLLGRWPDHEIGMWYIFFKNTDLRRIIPGSLWFGRRKRLALRLHAEQQLTSPPTPLDVWGGYRSGKPKIKTRQQTVYLTFDSEDVRQRVLKDLAADAIALVP